ncbi:MAG: chemotaxis protein CheA [Deltaproteobacteria bacterium]|nr:chemotaxis protein CheA [Deltaproteobacteria bacterium]
MTENARNMDDFEKELRAGFLDEAAGLLADAEQCFLNLETAKEDPQILEKIFRLAHNLKGSARAVGFNQMAEFTHELESLILKIKKREMEITDAAINLLLRCNDHLGATIQALKKDMDAQVDSSSLLSDIAHILSPSALPQQQPTATSTLTEQPTTAPALAEQPTTASTLAEQPTTAPTLAEQPTAAVSTLPQQPTVAAPAQPQPSPGPTPVDLDRPKSASTAPTPQKAANQEPESIRISTDRIEEIVNKVGELVLLVGALRQQKDSIGDVNVHKTVDQLVQVTKGVQDLSLGLRMVPLRQTFQKMNRIVRDVSKAVNKDVRLVISGEDTELDKTVVERIADPLVHLVRNAVDHGLESPEERAQAGKPSQGTVQLSAYHRSGYVIIEVAEDGRGMDSQKLIAKAKEKGLLRADQSLSHEDAYQLIFAPGFSTKAEVSNISGRGVGMDVVKHNVAELKGDIEIDTALGKGTCFRIWMPLTLSIIDGMVIRSEAERYVIPMAHVAESLQPKDHDVHFITGLGEVLNLRGEQLPLYRLGPVLGRKNAVRPTSQSLAIVVRTARKPFSVLVDDIVGQQQVVIKRLGREVQNIRGLTGGAVMTDGQVALILDFPELVQKQNPISFWKGING